MQKYERLNMSGKLFIISAPSGAGKTTLVRHSLAALQENYSIVRIVTYTTKSPRIGEDVSGKDYYFLARADFEQKIAEGYFLEWSLAYGHYYGTPASVLERLKQKESCVLILDRAGALRIKDLFPEAILIWIYTSSMDVLKQRLEFRASENQEEVERRLSIAVSEIEQERLRPAYNFHVLNEDFYESVAKLHEIFMFFLNQSA
jgi:guanylate kinase